MIVRVGSGEHLYSIPLFAFSYALSIFARSRVEGVNLDGLSLTESRGERNSWCTKSAWCEKNLPFSYLHLSHCFSQDSVLVLAQCLVLDGRRDRN